MILDTYKLTGTLIYERKFWPYFYHFYCFFSTVRVWPTNSTSLLLWHCTEPQWPEAWDYLKLVSSKTPPFSTDDFYKLLQKIAALETKIRQLDVNVEVNGLCGNNTTLPWTQNSGQEDVNTRLTNTNKITKKKDSSLFGKKYGSSSSCNSIRSLRITRRVSVPTPATTPQNQSLTNIFNS